MQHFLVVDTGGLKTYFRFIFHVSATQHLVIGQKNSLSPFSNYEILNRMRSSGTLYLKLAGPVNFVPPNLRLVRVRATSATTKNSNFSASHGTTRAPTSLSTSFRFHFLTSQLGFSPHNQFSSRRGNIPERLTSNLKRKHSRYLHLCVYSRGDTCHSCSINQHII
ncbi:uncharacterized protein LOC120355089 [Nilaparvata lugens]|uniref:uncharacterized protein LOC120355089 n=1 Tax=Nilaparvata lugens TaxID=108931 RepID=UPI00193CB8AF|nr:uncharacterized protein LOC120355089 [Nilaparvata lugens]